jgi:hypothetical protein
MGVDGKEGMPAAELTPHGPWAGPSLAGPALSSPAPSLGSHTPSVLTPAPAASAPTCPPVVEPVPPPEREHTGNLLDVLACTFQILNTWSNKGWELSRDQMHMVRAVAGLVSVCCQSGWHTLPHNDEPNAGTLLSRMRMYVDRESPKTPETTRGSADKVAHAPSKAPTAPTLACSAPKALVAHAPHAGSTLPPWPPRSKKCPPPRPLSKKSYADTICNVTSLVNLAKTIPNLPADCILAMHQASLPPVSNKRCINSMTAGPTWHQVLIQVDPIPPMFCFSAIVGRVNCSLTSAESDLRVDSCIHMYGGISLLTNCIATQSEISLIGSAITAGLAPLKPAESSLPTSRSYLKIVDVPYFRGLVPITPDQIRDVMGQSHMVSSFILANSPRVM